MWPLLGYIDFRCFIFLATMKNLPPVGANLTENDPRTPIFLFHFWNPDNFSILYVKFEENLMDFKNGPNTVNVFKWMRHGTARNRVWLPETNYIINTRSPSVCLSVCMFAISS